VISTPNLTDFWVSAERLLVITGYGFNNVYSAEMYANIATDSKSTRHSGLTIGGDICIHLCGVDIVSPLWLAE